MHPWKQQLQPKQPPPTFSECSIPSKTPPWFMIAKRKPRACLLQGNALLQTTATLQVVHVVANKIWKDVFKPGLDVG